MKRIITKMIKWILLGLLAVIIVMVIVWFIISSGKIRTYTEPNSLSEKFVMDINGALNGFFINSKNTDNPVLLLVSSGPGTDDYVFTDKYENMRLEDEYTVVYWDYRWMGIAYDSDADVDSITLDNLLDDTYQVTEYLKDRFNKEKIFIMGFSGGTQIALREVKRHPENYYAYIGMAQTVTDSYERDTLMYNFMKKVFTERNDNSALKRLENSIERLDNGNISCNEWYNFVDLIHDAGGGTIRNKSEFTGIVIPILTCSCYTVSEKINYIRGMKMYRNTPLDKELENFDYRQSITSLEIPAFFISGEYDYNCPWELVEEYCNMLSAPEKRFYKISDAAHSPLWENPEETCKVLKEIKKLNQN